MRASAGNSRRLHTISYPATSFDYRWYPPPYSDLFWRFFPVIFVEDQTRVSGHSWPSPLKWRKTTECRLNNPSTDASDGGNENAQWRRSLLRPDTEESDTFVTIDLTAGRSPCQWRGGHSYGGHRGNWKWASDWLEQTGGLAHIEKSRLETRREASSQSQLGRPRGLVNLAMSWYINASITAGYIYESRGIEFTVLW